MRNFLSVALLLGVYFGNDALAGTQAPQQVEVDAVAYRADSNMVLVELHYGVLQGALQFEKKGGKFVAPIRAKAEIIEDGKVLEAKDISREITFDGTSEALQQAGATKLLHGTSFLVHPADRAML